MSKNRPEPRTADETVKDRGKRRRTLTLGTGVLLMVGVLFTLDLLQTYRATQRHHEDAARVAAGLVESTLTRTLESVETALLALADEVPRADPMALEGRMRGQMDRILRFAPHFRQIVVAHADGRVIFDSHKRLEGHLLDLEALSLPLAGSLSRGQESYDRGLRLGLPLAGRYLPTTDTQSVPSPSRLLPVALRAGPDTLMVAALNPSALEEFLALPDTGKNGLVRVARFDGTSLLEGSTRPSILDGRRISVESAVAEGEESGTVSLGVESGLPLGDLAFQLSRRYPVVIQVAIAEKDIARIWLASDGTLIVWSSLALGGLMVLGSFLMREVSRRSDLENQVRLLALTRKVFAHSAEAIMITDANNRILTVNPPFTEITGYSAEEVVGQDPRVLASGRHDKVFYQDMWAALGSRGQWRGEIWNRRRDGRIYAQRVAISRLDDDEGKPLNYIAIFSDITEQRRRAEALNHLAHHDALTGLPNRSLLMDRLEQALIRADRDGTAVAVLFLDLDRFKPINDTQGHRVGDLVLEEVSRRLLSNVRQSDTVARLGGDEFVVLLHNANDTGSVERVALKLIDTVKSPVRVDGAPPLTLGVSVGIALCPRHGTDPRTLLAAADAAMYEAKRAGGGRPHFFPD